jgi:hypothetical protein
LGYKTWKNFTPTALTSRNCKSIIHKTTCQMIV